ncbi:MAG: hypothetical protein LBD22_03915 [Spirochaetaceae bacterium]|jgi:hypothetical protein|nr:hypothetical protein [Spirochaetaceae bacterium]
MCFSTYKKYAALLVFAAASFNVFAQDAAPGTEAAAPAAASADAAASGEKKPFVLPSWLTGAAGAVAGYFTKDDGTTSHLEPYSPFALGLMLTRFSISAASDLPVGVGDIMGTGDNAWKKNGRLKLDFNKLYNDPAIKQNGMDLNFGFNMEDFIQVEIALDGDSGLGISIGSLVSRFDMRINEQIFKMLSNGIREGEASYGLSLSGAVFTENITANYHRRDFIIPRLFVSITGTQYLPLVYIPRSDLSIKLYNKERVEMGLDGTAQAYMPFALAGSGGSDKVDLGGFDLSLQAEYALFPILDVGLTVLNLPLIPAALHTKATLKFDPDRNTLLEIDDLVNGGFNVDVGKATSPDTEYTAGELWVVRPMRWDWYALFRPIRTDFVVVRPNIGFTVLNPSEEGYFNLGFETSLNVGRAFTVSWFTGGYDGLCRNRLGLDLRLWQFARWFANLEMRSQSYAGAWTLKGAAVELGFKWGGGFSGLTNF